MMLSLNGLQVITDGCSYRRDRIPMCSLEECLKAVPDYPLRHVDEDTGIPFYDPDEVPENDTEFTEWYQEHVKRFFQISGGEEYDRLFAVHRLEHKLTEDGGFASFDAMACDGSSNYLKLTKNGNRWKVREAKMRGYGKDSKRALKDWIVTAYATDKMTDLPPITEDRLLLKLKPAQQKAKRALVEAEISQVMLPLSLELSVVRTFKVLKPSDFVFRIQAGGRDLTKDFNLTAKRLTERLAEMVEQRAVERQQQKDLADQELFSMIDTRELADDDMLTGILVTSDDWHLLG